MATRNPLLVIDGVETQTIGDVHFGRIFKNNVPLNRRGEYETLQMQSFLHLLNSKTNLKIQTGDLFDKPHISASVLLWCIKQLREFERNGLSDRIFIISGNHDDSKSSTEPTSWDILAKFFEDSHKVVFVKKWHLLQLTETNWMLLVGWNIHNSVSEAFIQAKDEMHPEHVISTVVCHLDRISYGDDSNVIPYDFLKSHGVATVITGHEHKPFHFFEGDMRVIGTGSLLPYSHAEDPEDNHYVTIKFEDLEKHDLEQLVNKHVRIKVNPEQYAEAAEMQLDCLSFQVQKVAQENLDDSEEQLTVVVEQYSATQLWKQAVEEVNMLDDEEATKLWQRIEEKGIENE